MLAGDGVDLRRKGAAGWTLHDYGDGWDGDALAYLVDRRGLDDLDALILDSPFADGLALIQRLGDPAIRRSDVPGFGDNIDRIRGCGLPTLILHGTDDRIIPVHEAESLYEAGAGRQKELLKIEGAGHNDLMMVGRSMYFGKIRDWVDSRADCGD